MCTAHTDLPERDASQDPRASGGRHSSAGLATTFDKAPAPAYEAQVLFRFPADGPAPVSDREVTGLCFPNQVLIILCV